MASSSESASHLVLLYGADPTGFFFTVFMLGLTAAQSRYTNTSAKNADEVRRSSAGLR